MAYINGVRVESMTRYRLLAVKLLSCGLAVGSGLPVGPEGPVIHMGSMIGAIIAPLPIWTTNVATRLGTSLTFPRFRNSKDHRDMTAAGAAAGVAAAFGAPIGGVIFAIEDITITITITITLILILILNLILNLILILILILTLILSPALTLAVSFRK